MINEPPRRLELHLSYICAQRCSFCSESDRMARWRRAPLRGDEVARVLVERRREGFDHVTFTGGEPTAHPALPRALAAARRLGFRTYLTTNGGLFSRVGYAEQVLPWVDELCLSLHGHDAASHESCTLTPGSFTGVLKALENVERYGLRTRLLTNTVVTLAGWEKLEDTIHLLLSHRKVSHCLLSNVAPEGRAARAYPDMAVPLRLWRERLPALAGLFEGSGISLRFFGLPLCVFSGRDDLSNDSHFSPRVTVERRAVEGRPGLGAVMSRDASRRRSKPPVCLSCRARRSCAGVFDRYLETFGPGELAPLR